MSDNTRKPPYRIRLRLSVFLSPLSPARVGDFLKKPVAEQLAAAREQAETDQGPDDSTDSRGASPDARQGLAQAPAEGGGADDDGDGVRDFLQPSTRPGALGRIAHY